jgi:hypothetical protein
MAGDGMHNVVAYSITGALGQRVATLDLVARR